MDNLLEIRNLKTSFKTDDGRVQAVDDVSLSIKPGEVLGLVGESGCGKTTTGRMILRAVDPTSGTIRFHRRDGDLVDMASLDRGDLKTVRREIQMIFQDPYASLNPRLTALEIIEEPLKAYGWGRRERHSRVGELMEIVGLDQKYVRRFPHAFSGGQRQRIGIARALALRPAVLVADEPVSALDVSVQAQVLNLLRDLRRELGLTLIFIAHDLSVVRYLCDYVAVMYQGRLVEQGATNSLFNNPHHPYTAKLLRAVPTPDPDAPWMVDDTDAARPANPFQISGLSVTHKTKTTLSTRGCVFAAECPYVQDACRRKAQIFESVSDDQDNKHSVACRRAHEIDLPTTTS